MRYSQLPVEEVAATPTQVGSSLQTTYYIMWVHQPWVACFCAADDFVTQNMDYIVQLHDPIQQMVD
jgi:hypothetical protein